MRWTASFIALLCLSPGAALADDEPIVVTATRSQTPLSHLASRVDIVGRDAIETQGLATLVQALGPSAVQSGGAGAITSLFLRGTNSKHALALFDGVRLNDPANPTAQYDFGLDTLGGLDRVETLRGPASSVYGSDAIGGVVNLIPRRGADRRFAPFGEAAFGSLDTTRALIGAAGSTTALDYGLSYERFDTDGYDQTPARMSTATGDPDGATLTTFTGTARFKASKAVGFDVLARWREGESGFDTLSGGPSGFQRADDPALGAKTRQSLARLGADVSAGAWLWRLSGGAVRSHNEEHDGAARTADAEGVRRFADATARFSPANSALAQNSIVTLGLSWASEKAVVGATAFADALRKQEDQKAAFVVAQGDFGSHWSATASARIDDFDGFGAHDTYALGLVGHVADLRAFASYGTAFKAPSLGERFGTGAFNVGNPGLAPEQSRSFELGADWRVLSAATFGASYYQTRISNLIDYDFATLRNINVRRAAIDGAEAYVETAPAAWLTLRASYAWTDATDADTGAQLLRRPEHAWGLDADLRPAARARLHLAWRLVGERADVTYDDDGFFLSSSGRVPSYSVGALSGTYALTDRLEAFARIDNVADKTYEQPAAYAGAPRTGLVGVRAKF
jgi:vitamin B12 transporter